MEGSAAMSRNILSELTGSFKMRNAKDLHEKLLALLAPFCDDHPPVHPKQSQVKSIALEHFAASQEIDSGRIIVFASFREYVAEIVRHLNEEGPIIRATPFVGQSSGKARDGMSQKMQLEVSI
jgi:ERCC4-related helicase